MNSSTNPDKPLEEIREIFELTPREWKVLLHVADDLSNAEIAERLCVKTKSVENYRARIGRKLNQKGCRLLARYARRYRAELRHCYQLITGEAPPSITNS